MDEAGDVETKAISIRRGAPPDGGPGGGPGDWSAELALIRDAQDPRAFAALFRHFAPRIRAVLIRSGSTPEFAEDCAQDAMATLWRKAHLYDPARGPVAAWVFAIARNRRIDLIRRVRPQLPDLAWDPVPPPPPVEALALRQDGARLATAVAGLPLAQRRIVERAYFADRSHGEIAAETGLPLGTVKSRLRLALSRLREAMA